MAHLWGYLFALVAAVGFSAKAILVKLGYAHGANAHQMLFYRMLFALPFFAAIALYHIVKKIIKQNGGKNIPHGPSHDVFYGKDFFYAFCLGALGYYASSFLDFKGLELISASLERILLFLYPTFVVLLNAIWLKNKPTSRQYLALALAYSGIIIIYGLRPAQTQVDIFAGSLYVIAACVTYAVFLIGSVGLIKKWGATFFTAVTMTFACLLVIAHFFMAEPKSVYDIEARALGYAVLLTIFSTLLPTFALGYALEKIGSSSTSIISATGPVVTLVLAYFILNEEYRFSDIAGSLIVIAGVLLLGKKQHKK